jgi:hypothetical protein
LTQLWIVARVDAEHSLGLTRALICTSFEDLTCPKGTEGVALSPPTGSTRADGDTSESRRAEPESPRPGVPLERRASFYGLEALADRLYELFPGHVSK